MPGGKHKRMDALLRLAHLLSRTNRGRVLTGRRKQGQGLAHHSPHREADIEPAQVLDSLTLPVSGSAKASTLPRLESPARAVGDLAPVARRPRRMGITVSRPATIGSRSCCCCCCGPAVERCTLQHAAMSTAAGRHSRQSS